MDERLAEFKPPEDSPLWADPQKFQDALFAWRMERTIQERANGIDLERDRPSPEPFVWID